MEDGKTKVVFVNSDKSFLQKKKNDLRRKDLKEYFYPFTSFGDAIEFVEQDASSASGNSYYMVVEDKILNSKYNYSLEKLSSLNNCIDELEVIILTGESNKHLRKQVMQYPFVSAFIVKPIPDNYIDFLIEGAA